MASSIERRIRALEAAASHLLEPTLELLILASHGDQRAQQVLGKCSPTARLIQLILAAISIEEVPFMPAPVSEYAH